ncbi:uncharacterized protein LOC121367432 [Gigantopelta aegis]|uniref:uncharacterized protein LOC121367432 n=1 Tax=Gigantopelta aegis TaxID=1735272 RepID=UPI001B88A6DC|nr:uncharacterized protein LOC121367432 [Gigantopelta aegis]
MTKLYNTCVTLVYLLHSVVTDVWTGVPSYGMDDKKVCLLKSVHQVFVEDQKSMVIIGKKTPTNSAAAAQNCTIQFSPVSDMGYSSLRLQFDNFYINDCDITLTITQSSTSLFNSDVQQLVKLSCADPSPGVLYASRDFSVRVTLSREDIYLRNYNFRVNVSLSDGPPQTGPSVAVIIGIATALLALICIIAFIMVKYTRMKSAVLRERRAERAIENALHVHSSQELHNGIAYTTLPCQADSNGALHPGHHDSSQDSHESVASHPEGGHLLSKKGHGQHHILLTRLPANKERLSSSHPEEMSHVLFEPLNSHTHLHPDHPGGASEGVTEVGSSSEGSDLPPSYEEALEMPKPPESLESPNYMNVDTL